MSWVSLEKTRAKILNKLKTTKIMEYLNIIQLSVDVTQGVESPFKALAIAKEYEKIVIEARKAIEEVAQEEASKYPKEFDSDGYSFTKREGSKRFNFKEVDEWKEANDNLKEIESKYKTAWANSQNNIGSVTEDGEILQIPLVTFSKDSLLVKKSKS